MKKLAFDAVPVLKLKEGFKTTYRGNKIECVDDGTGVLDFVVWNQAETIVAHIYPSDEGAWSIWLNVEDVPCGDVHYLVCRENGYAAVHWSALNADEESAEFETPEAALIELVKHNNI